MSRICFGVHVWSTGRLERRIFVGKRLQPPFYAISFFVGMGYWHRLLAWLK